MNKVLLIGLTPPLEGGSERHIYEISSRMKNSTVLTQKGSSCKRKIEVYTLNNSSFLRSISFFFSCLFYAIFLTFSKKQYSTIHVHENLLYFLIPLLSLRYKTVVTVHGIKGFKFYDVKFLWFFFRQALKSANQLIAVNKEDEKLLKHFFKKVSYIPNGVDHSAYENLHTAVKKKISFIGRIHEQKGLVYLLESFQTINKDFPDFSLEIIGEINDYAKELKKKFQNKNIIWRGYLSDRNEIIKSLSSAYCICLPSLWEGLPLTLFEALAAGRPVILSDIPAFKSVIKDEAIFFKCKETRDLTDKIESLLKNKKKGDEIGKKGEKLAMEYSWNKIAKRTENEYKI
ncbi:MAG: glycosyltransferase family 4 protein [Nanoarchaeota archaeon]|nr:glycosyltransferase family 4 protein [Nanoarchaeota archaeon]